MAPRAREGAGTGRIDTAFGRAALPSVQVLQQSLNIAKAKSRPYVGRATIECLYIISLLIMSSAMQPLTPAKNLYLMVQDVARLLRRRIDQRAQAVGLTSAQWRILSSVARAEFLNHEPLNQAALAEQMDMEPITLSRQVDRMQAAGLIERRPNPLDRRAYRLFVTENSKPLLNSFRQVGTECMTSALAGISESELTTVMDVLSRMRTNIVSMHEDGHGHAPTASVSTIPLEKGRVA
jgi:DNA-binding MarR family transcriptional regulator